MTALFIIILSLSLLIQLYFWLVQFDQIARSQKVQEVSHHLSGLPTVALIIAAKNEAENITRNLSSWLEQDYQHLDIIVIDDHSEDETWQILQSQSDGRLTSLQSPEEAHGKKAALAYAISTTTSEWIITTDADCTPKSTSWISHLINSRKDADMIIGYSPYQRSKGWVSILVSYESWYVAMQYISALLLGRPYMSVGRNLAFKKELFEDVGGYESHQDILSGDDDLFLQEARRRGKITSTIDPTTWVWTQTPSGLRNYLRQKKRHLTTAPRYEMRYQLVLILLFLSQLLFYLSTVVLSFSYPWVLLILLVRYIWISWVARRSQKFLFLPVKWWSAPMMDLCLCIFYLVLSPSIRRSSSQW